jgi:hypothetical protein
MRSNNIDELLDEIYTMQKSVLFLKNKFRSIQKKKDGSKLYLEKEMKILEDYLYQQGTMETYTILMDFQIGTKVGELVVLKGIMTS